MTEKQLALIDEVLSDWTQLSNKRLLSIKRESKLWLESFSKRHELCKKRTLVDWQCVISDYPLIIEKAKQVNRATGITFNSLHLFSLGELTHSGILAHLLNTNASHGQGNLFLKLFLGMIGIESPDSDNWVVTAEEGRVDIMLRRQFPLSVILIENKSNWAADQPYQLYRYWYENIYPTIEDKPIDYGQKNKSKFRVIYMPPSGGKAPVENSLQRPDYLSEPLPAVLPMEIECLSFYDFVVRWLGLCVPEIPEGNHRLREYIKQYIEFWKN